MANGNNSNKGIDWEELFRIWPVAILFTISFSIGNSVLAQIWAAISGGEKWSVLAWVLAIAIVLITAGFTALAALMLAKIKI